MSKSTEPKEVLFDISKKVDQIHKSMDADLPSELRSNIHFDSKRHKILEALESNNAMSSRELCNELDVSDVTGALRRLFDSYLVDRHHSGSTYKYQINSLGEKALSEMGTTEDSDILAQPWDETNLARGEYIVLKLVDEHDEHPMGKDLESCYLDEMETSKDNGSTAYRASARLTKLFKEGYVERTPEQPYRYWLTEKGKGALDQ